MNSLPSRKSRGKLIGDFGEKVMEKHHSIAFKRGIARVWKVPTPMLVAGYLGSGIYKARFTEKSTVDYSGLVLSSGQAIFAECKSFDLGITDCFDMSQVKKHQREVLELAANHDALSMLVVIAVVSPTVYTVHAMEWAEVSDYSQLPMSFLKLWQSEECYLSKFV